MKQHRSLWRVLQSLAHYHGYEDFREALIQSLFLASHDTEDFDDKRLTQQYRYLANGIVDLVENEPEFSREVVE